LHEVVEEICIESVSHNEIERSYLGKDCNFENIVSPQLEK
jgi:hypothetical protein